MTRLIKAEQNENSLEFQLKAHNWTAERHWITLFEMGTCTLINLGKSQEMWPYAVMQAAYIRNRSYNNRLKQTLYFALTARSQI